MNRCSEKRERTKLSGHAETKEYSVQFGQVTVKQVEEVKDRNRAMDYLESIS